MIDVLIYESGNGGELSLKDGDIETTDGLFNIPYLSHFGGNVEVSTKGNELEGEERIDWWGNIFLEDESQMNSELERALNNNALTSAGRANIEAAAKKDLQVLSDIADVSTTVSITGNDKIYISDKVDKTVVNLIWDSTKSELIEEITI
jgi:hypothetical protein